MRRAGALITLLFVSAPVDAGEAPKPPYWASINAGRARMRTGPARAYPATWIYQRADLPIRVVGVFKEWRKVEDPDGVQGWMQANLLSATRTAIVRGTDPLPMFATPTSGSRLKWRAAPGVVGRISQCANGWCSFDVKGRSGYVETEALWGLDRSEMLP